MPAIPVGDRLIVALDFPSVGQAEATVGRLGSVVSFYKIGLELIYAGGIDLARRLIASGKKVFLDTKLLDIDNTVAGAIRGLVAIRPDFVTVHAYPRTMQAAAQARGNAPLKILAVTVLTSMDDTDLATAGYTGALRDLVNQRAGQAHAAGMDGIVASPAEAASIRKVVGPEMVIVTPGVRPAGHDTADQKRVATPEAAIRGGADYLVVGRPITAAVDPVGTARAIIGEIDRTLRVTV
jgi:orotidine-5'-phosphate decarboxylase